MAESRMMRGPDLTADTVIRYALRTPRKRSCRPGDDPRPATLRVTDAGEIIAREVPVCPSPPRL